MEKDFGMPLEPALAAVLVSSVEPDCDARDLGIVEGDVVMTVQGSLGGDAGRVRLTVQNAHEQHRRFLAVLIEGGNGARWVSLSMGGANS